MGIWVDGQGKIDQIWVNEASIGFIKESDVQKYYCQAEPERLDKQAVINIIETVTKNIPT